MPKASPLSRWMRSRSIDLIWIACAIAVAVAVSFGLSGTE
jgi:hypothetical protein